MFVHLAHCLCCQKNEVVYESGMLRMNEVPTPEEDNIISLKFGGCAHFTHAESVEIRSSSQTAASQSAETLPLLKQPSRFHQPRSQPPWPRRNQRVEVIDAAHPTFEGARACRGATISLVDHAVH